LLHADGGWEEDMFVAHVGGLLHQPLGRGR
jgi:hypothetical protein